MSRESGNIRVRKSSILARPSAFERFQSVDLSFGLAIAPAFSQCVFDGGDISLHVRAKRCTM
jgi:hypothetical protein